MDERGILILYASAGAGHMIAARALEQAFRAPAPQIPVQAVDVLALTNGFFRHLYAGGYMALVRHAPTVMGWIYDSFDRPPRQPSEALRLLIQNANKGPIVDYIRDARPRLVVSTHFLPGEVVAQMRRAGEYDGRHVIVTTDLETHRLWVQEPADRYYAATPLGAAYLPVWGARAESIRVTGIPVRPGFGVELTRAVAAQRRGLDPERPVVLLLCSGLGFDLPQMMLAELLRLPATVQVVVLVGRSAALQARLADIAAAAGPRISVLGFTEQMHEYMRAADIAIGKPGGLTVSESLACGLPLVIVQPYPGQEIRNSDYLLEHGAAVKVNNPRLLAHRVRELLADAALLTRLRAGALRLARPTAAADIAQDALALCAGPPA
jgi:processive 1,2-diacylglycerol beta-glucosyltransferase